MSESTIEARLIADLTALLKQQETAEEARRTAEGAAHTARRKVEEMENEARRLQMALLVMQGYSNKTEHDAIVKLNERRTAMKKNGGL